MIAPRQLGLLEPVPDSVSLPSSQAPRRGEHEKKRVNVPRTSVEAYEQCVDPRARQATVLRLLHRWDGSPGPTSAEMAQWIGDTPPRMELVLYVRRGLSDLKDIGAVEHGPKRKCSVSGLTCVTWRVKSR